MNDTNQLNSILCSGSNIDVTKTFDSFIFTPLMWGKYILFKAKYYYLTCLFRISITFTYTYFNYSFKYDKDF